MTLLRNFRRWLRGLEPRVLASMKGPLLGRLRPWLDDKDVLSFHRTPLAMGVAIGMFCGLIPGPLQVAGSLLLCVWLRANLIAAAAATFYTNPLTIVPLYMLAFQIGRLILPADATDPATSFAGLNWSNGVIDGLSALGLPLLLGLPTMGLMFAAIAYLLVQLLCLLPVFQRRRLMQKRIKPPLA
ncbi:MAG: DUF2062 domain-containing protein [Betaproteobacteria bacterium]|jgi:uncharacterized protein (DUF2062 family)|nr:DUF2062 domain-containing protein [Betaproteobacteria bacterium]MBK7656357.1 DUF2062 domain-containing protein [Betaproteobacteria bacterium]MBP6647123.1 DUF2062 domain-containing protein [Burkholderiaceae bacterium]